MFGCAILSPIEYKERHDKIGHCIYWKVCKYTGISDCEKGYKHQPEPITESKRATILKDFVIQTDRKNNNNRADFVVKDCKRKTYFSIGM